MSLPGRRADGVALRLLLQRAARKKENGVLSVPPVWAARQSAVLLAGCRGMVGQGGGRGARSPAPAAQPAVFCGIAGRGPLRCRLCAHTPAPVALAAVLPACWHGVCLQGRQRCAAVLPAVAGRLVFCPAAQKRAVSIPPGWLPGGRRRTCPQKQRVTGPKIPCKKEKTQGSSA